MLEAGVFGVDGEVDADPALRRAVEVLEQLDGLPGPEVVLIPLVLVEALDGAAMAFSAAVWGSKYMSE